MTKKTRLIVFLACFFLFILISPLAILYSQGYRIDFEERKVSQTGAIFIRALPRQADVYIDGKLNKRTDFFFGSALIENLLPKKHEITVTREGYHSWKKSFEIREREVVEAKNIILFPETVDINLILKNVENLLFLSDQKIILKERPDQDESIDNDWSLKAYHFEQSIKSHLANKEDFARFFPSNKEDFIKKAELITLEVLENSKKIYIEIAEEEEVKAFELKIENNQIMPAEKISFPLKNIAYKKINNDFYYLDESGFLFVLQNIPENISTSTLQEINKKQLTVSPFKIDPKKNYQLKIFKDFIFLKENKDVYRLNFESEIFEIFAEQINSMEISPDNEKLAYFSNHEVWVLFLSDKNDPPQKKKSEKIFLIRLSEQITSLSWINNDYLSFTAGTSIKISETDDRDRINIIDILNLEGLLENKKPKQIFFNQNEKKLYFLTDTGSFYGSTNIIP